MSSYFNRLFSPLAAGAALTVMMSACRVQPGPGESETAPSWEVLDARARVEAQKDRVDFSRHIKPILEAKCVSCHSGDRPEGGFRLEQKRFAFSDGVQGARIVPGDPLRSPLIRNIDTAHSDLNVMPPVGNRVTSAEKAILRRWIDQGADWPGGESGRLSLKPD